MNETGLLEHEDQRGDQRSGFDSARELLQALEQTKEPHQVETVREFIKLGNSELPTHEYKALDQREKQFVADVNAIPDDAERYAVKGAILKEILQNGHETIFYELAGLYADIHEPDDSDESEEIVPQADTLKGLAGPAKETGLDQALIGRVAKEHRILTVPYIRMLAAQIDTCRQDESIRKAAASNYVIGKNEQWQSFDDSGFDLTEAEVHTAVSLELEKSLKHAEYWNVMRLSANFDLSAEQKKEVADFTHASPDIYNLVPGVASPGLQQRDPELHASIYARVAAEIAGDSEAAERFVNSLEHAAKAPWLRPLLDKALQNQQARLAFGSNLRVMSAELPWFDEICAEHDIDASRLDIIPAHFIPEDEHAFSAEKARLAGFINRLQWGKLKPGELEASGLSEAAAQSLAAIPRKVADSLGILERRLDQDPKVPVEDQLATLFHDEELIRKGGFTPLQRTTEAMLARYLANFVQGDMAKLNEKAQESRFGTSLDIVLEEAIKSYGDAYERHIPHYDNLYNKFDDLRRHGKMLEVYLGRDGVYAYFGRQAQKAVRAATGTKSAKPLPDIKYIVYNRDYVSNFEAPTKHRYLQEQGITQEVNPVFYDTGFEGTIPLDILDVMGARQEVIDRSIYMLSAKDKRYRLMDWNVADDQVSKIENDSKDTDSAIGVAEAQDTGKLQPVAMATRPAEQLMYGMTRRAILRHYMVKELMAAQA